MNSLKSRKKILIVATSTSTLGETGPITGACLVEITTAYEQFQKSGYEIDIVTPLGGRVPLDVPKNGDTQHAALLNDAAFFKKTQQAFRPWQVSSEDYCAILFIGGHGALFDFPENIYLQKLATEIFDNDGVVAAIGHGVAALLNVTETNGPLLVQSHELTCFANAEEKSSGKDRFVPYLLETRLKEEGAHISTAPNFTSHVIISGRLITGQNSISAHEVAQGVVELLGQIENGRMLPEKGWCEWQDPSTFW